MQGSSENFLMEMYLNILFKEQKHIFWFPKIILKTQKTSTTKGSLYA